MTRLERLYTEQRQSPWLDNLARPYLRDGTLAEFVADGIRGVTANPTILAKAIQASDAYDAQFHALTAAGCSVEDSYWELAVHDVTDALACCVRPTTTRAAAMVSYRSKSPRSWRETPRPRSPRPPDCTSASPGRTCW
jgi:hypothetical protein